MVRALGLQPYASTYAAMRAHVARQSPEAADEIWWLEHEPVYTLGLRGNRQFLHHVPEALLVQSDRGGEVTWHGPGQLIIYLMLDLQRRGPGIRALVTLLEASVIDLLADHGIVAERESGAPGVYVAGAKVAALGLRVSRGISYHGLSLNVDCDLSAFSHIDPCGHPGRRVTSMHDLGMPGDVAFWGPRLVALLVGHLRVARAGRPSG